MPQSLVTKLRLLTRRCGGTIVPQLCTVAIDPGRFNIFLKWMRKTFSRRNGAAL
jgi:hypothetical protein